MRGGLSSLSKLGPSTQLAPSIKNTIKVPKLTCNLVIVGSKQVSKSSKQKRYDLYTFVAEAALKKGKPFQLGCNCGGIVTIMPPFQDEYVICPRCESRIRMLVIEGDPGYIIGRTSDGKPTLLPVQGSAKPHPDTLSEAEREAILSKIKAKLPKETK